MEHTKELLSVPLASLVPSRFNVRRHAVGQVEELAALIEAQGLLHNLVVTEQEVGRGKSRKLKFAVAAGERRRRALLLLQQRGCLPKDHEVLCELVPPERALEVSLAENSGREAMHPADEFEAFKALIDEGQGVEDVAARFGVSVLTVQRRLKLSALSPKLLALYREDGINLDQLMALTLSDDHSVQERTWFDAQPWDRTPAALRRRLTAGEVEAAGSALVRFVGIEAYEVAGGVVRRDLFDDVQSRFLSDPALLERLATEKLGALAATVREEGWKWVEARLSVDSQALRQFARCEHASRQPTAAEQQELDALDRRAAELEQQAQALDDAPEWSPNEAEMIDLEEQDIAARRKAIHEALKTWMPEQQVHAGVIVTIGRDGDVEVMRGLVRDEDRKAVAAAVREKGAKAAKGAKEHRDPGDAGDDEGAPLMSMAAERRTPGCSEALTKRLAAHRTMALQAMLAQNTAVALASVVHVFVLRTFGADDPRRASALQVTPQLSGSVLEAAADDLKTGRAWQAVQQAKEGWRARLPAQQGDWFGWLIGLPQAELIDLLALCGALTVNALPGAGAAGSANAIAAALGLDMADWWEPTAEAYLNHVPKAQIVAVLKEAGPGLAGGGVEAMKKDALVQVAASRLAGTRWLPVPLRRLPD
ncbi:ParB/RepB/Spo0J family partition protein [Rubrivivax sp. RP6-9]|uniref:ParB/RepB/Spo0J family partition protein n=1 Tax=Rubrivivax sp. RP6-9 TaxID=3415750 RepID=UPI003CC6330C